MPAVRCVTWGGPHRSGADAGAAWRSGQGRSSGQGQMRWSPRAPGAIGQTGNLLLGHTKGLTLLEILTVLVIVGILLTLSGQHLIRSLRAAELREAATDLTADLRRARSTAQRGNRSVTITWTPEADGQVRTYSVGGVPRSLSNGVSFQCQVGCTSTGPQRLVYMAPFGELSTENGALSGVRLKVSSPLAGLAPLSVRVVGVTGKVMLAAGTP